MIDGRSSMIRTPYYTDESVTLWGGDALDVLRGMPDSCVHAVVTDPPAGIGFMGKEWDGPRGGREAWSAWLAGIMREALRVTRPGGHALVWALPRTAHWTACGLEDAGWEIRDRITHLFGSGFPKSRDVSKAIDAAAGAPREVVGDSPFAARKPNGSAGVTSVGLSATPGAQVTAPATPAAQQWAGWGTALKPGAEDWWVARKPLDGTVAANVLEWGTGALNVDGCRVGTQDNLGRPTTSNTFLLGGCASVAELEALAEANQPTPDGRNMARASLARYRRFAGTVTTGNPAGRWPANVVLDGDAAAELDEQVPVAGSNSTSPGSAGQGMFGDRVGGATHDTRDSGGASRFFPVFRYEPKAPTFERPRVDGQGHSTVKPLDLMRWLVRLVCPPGGTVLDMFAGSGTTGEACIVEGFRAVLVESDPASLPLIVARLSKPIQPDLFGAVPDPQPVMDWPRPAAPPPPAVARERARESSAEPLTLFDGEEPA
jgi:DNA methylase